MPGHNFFKRATFILLAVTLCFASCDIFTGTDNPGSRPDGDSNDPDGGGGTTWQYFPRREITYDYSGGEKIMTIESERTSYSYRSETNWSQSRTVTTYDISTGKTSSTGEFTMNRDGNKAASTGTTTTYDTTGNKVSYTKSEGTSTYFEETEIVASSVSSTTYGVYRNGVPEESGSYPQSSKYNITKSGPVQGVTTTVTDSNIRHYSSETFDANGVKTGYTIATGGRVGNEFKLVYSHYDSSGTLLSQSESYFARVN